MSEHTFELLTRTGRLAADLESITSAADREVRAAAAELLRDRTYAGVRIVAEWHDETVIHLRIRGAERESHARSFADFYAHELFLLLNLAVPGSIGIASPQLDAYAFEVAWVAAKRNAWPAIEPVPLDRVLAWYDTQNLGTSQRATTPIARALFALLHLARLDPAEPAALLHLGHALAALEVDEPRLAPFFEVRQAAVAGTGVSIHPMHDESLDPLLDDGGADAIAAADLAASVVWPRFSRGSRR
ncbi:MAG TPA: hypothetical protein VN605_09920, partial [Thermoanaerobaculia bacterium]|nr:hypothetical protein [Thermoanaerobaculia bacterium]